MSKNTALDTTSALIETISVVSGILFLALPLIDDSGNDAFLNYTLTLAVVVFFWFLRSFRKVLTKSEGVPIPISAFFIYLLNLVGLFWLYDFDKTEKTDLFGQEITYNYALKSFYGSLVILSIFLLLTNMSETNWKKGRSILFFVTVVRGSWFLAVIAVVLHKFDFLISDENKSDILIVVDYSQVEWLLVIGVILNIALAIFIDLFPPIKVSSIDWLNTFVTGTSQTPQAFLNTFSILIIFYFLGWLKLDIWPQLAFGLIFLAIFTSVFRSKRPSTKLSTQIPPFGGITTSVISKASRELRSLNAEKLAEKGYYTSDKIIIEGEKAIYFNTGDLIVVPLAIPLAEETNQSINDEKMFLLLLGFPEVEALGYESKEKNELNEVSAIIVSYGEWLQKKNKMVSLSSQKEVLSYEDELYYLDQAKRLGVMLRRLNSHIVPFIKAIVKKSAKERNQKVEYSGKEFLSLVAKSSKEGTPIRNLKKEFSSLFRKNWDILNSMVNNPDDVAFFNLEHELFILGTATEGKIKLDSREYPIDKKAVPEESEEEYYYSDEEYEDDPEDYDEYDDDIVYEYDGEIDAKAIEGRKSRQLPAPSREEPAISEEKSERIPQKEKEPTPPLKTLSEEQRVKRMNQICKLYTSIPIYRLTKRLEFRIEDELLSWLIDKVGEFPIKIDKGIILIIKEE